ncbi:amino acid ABC transporter permease [Microbacterium sp.]|uniref:amino acid ABC transporter permease n=1 Tax=Microbacterium sp. TaxID=51671 RepID=UPI0009268E68|nr:amino acid ABC transporter permease [Microbacterium sp.]MBN9189704.1 amino acid ABC transporter permease [Microbacterium sp.]MBN9193916.1 amino acid ABC transporter permease [Microbacterium sp.]OJU70133.1 MAG: hypothetical protein BGO04_05470 [Microbacterium sp. 70-38]
MTLDTLLSYASGLGISLVLTVFSLLFGLAGGLLAAMASLATSRWVSWPAIALVELGRGAPGLVLLYLVYFSLPQIGFTIDAVPSAVVALSIMTAAYTSEIFVAGFRAVGKGQWEACESLGMSYFSTARLVIIPQAVSVVIPPLIGWSVLLFQATSLAFAISVPELISRAYDFATSTYEYGLAFIVAGAVYLGVSLLAVGLVHQSLRLRRRVATH